MKNNQGLSGTANFNHQIGLAYLITNINNHYKKLKKSYIATSETRIDFIYKKEKKYFVPDLIVWDLENPLNSILWLENTTNRDLNKNIEKSKLAFKHLKFLEEAFVYNYQTKTFYKLVRNEKEPKIDSKSNVLNLDLSKLISSVIS